MEIKQSRHSNRIGYAFGEDELQYSVEDGSGSRSFSVAYSDITRDRQTLVERNQWLGNVGLLWLALGAVLTAISWFSDKPFAPSIWLLVGAACYAVYRWRTTRYIIVPTEKGNLLVIDDDDGKRILDEIQSRRAAHFRSEYDFMPESDSADQLRNRFKWLHTEGVLTDEELKQRLTMVDANDPTRLDVARTSDSTRLN